MPRSKEAPAQQIKRLEKALEREQLKTQIYNDMFDILEKEHGIDLRKKILCRALLLAKEKKVVKLATACGVLGFSRQAVYQWKMRLERREEELSPLKGLVHEGRRLMPRLGTRKLYKLIKSDLANRGIKIGRDCLFRYLRNENLLVKPRKNYTKTTNSKHWLRKHPNLLKDRNAEQVEEIFVSDNTYIKTDEGTYYLSLVTDAYSRKIMGYEVSPEMKASDVVKALKMAIAQRSTRNETIHHSDRGLQYCSSEYQAVLRKNGLRASMTDGYDCYQNALAERVNGILKQEFLFYQC